MYSAARIFRLQMLTALALGLSLFGGAMKHAHDVQASHAQIHYQHLQNHQHTRTTRSGRGVGSTAAADVDAAKTAPRGLPGVDPPAVVTVAASTLLFAPQTVAVQWAKTDADAAGLRPRGAVRPRGPPVLS